MLDVFKKWTTQYFADEEAIILLLLLGVGLILIVGIGDVLAPVFTAVIIAFLLQGMVNMMVRHKVPHVVAVSVTTLVFIGLCLAVLLVVLPIAWRQLASLFAELPRMLEQGQNLLSLLPEKYPQMISTDQINEWMGMAQTEVGKLGQVILSFSLSSLPSLVALMVYAVLIPFMVFFFLKDKPLILGWLAAFLPSERPVLNRVWVEMNEQIANYIRGKVIEILIIGVISYVTFAFMGMRYAALMGLLVGLSVLIPYIGATVVTIPVMLISYFQWGWTDDFAYLMLAYAIIQAFDGNILVPVLFSEAVNLHPIAILVAVLFFGGLWGFWGVFFAIPLATLVKAIISAWPHAGKVKEMV